MRAYSMDLRERALLDSDAGMKAADVAAKYRVSGSWVRLLKQRRRETGEVAPRVQRHGRRPMLEPHLHTLAALIAAQPDRTLAELKDALATPASVPTVWRAVHALGLTVKKNGPPIRTRSAFQARSMRVPSNIEAGIKYLGLLVKQLGREDYAIAGYNGGPGRVAGRRPMPLESLQYVIGVGSYRGVLKAYEPSVRMHAERLTLTELRQGEDWWALSQRLEVPVAQLRLHNPFLAARRLRAGYVVAYPPEPRDDVFEVINGTSRFKTDLGDNYLKVAFTLGVDLDLMRQANQLWRLQPPLHGTELVIPVDSKAEFTQYRVRAGEDIAQVATRMKADPWDIVRDNSVWNEELNEGMVLRIRRRPEPVAPAFQVHRVRRGETLAALASRYKTSVRDIQAANGLGRRTVIRIGQTLRIPLRRTEQVAPAFQVHRVRRGETLTALARRYKTSVRDIQAANGLGRRTVIRIGQTLRIPLR